MKKIFDFFSKLPPIVKKAAAVVNSVHAGVEAFQQTWNIHFPPKVETVIDTVVEVVNKADAVVEKETDAANGQ